MIEFDQDGVRFNYRVAAIAFDEGRVLLQSVPDEVQDPATGSAQAPSTGSGQAFWCLPGGRAELREPAQETVRREMLEELSVAVRVERLVWVIENFFQHRGRTYHELGLYFLVELPERSPLRGRREPFVGYETDGSEITFQWHDLARLVELPLHPTFLRTALGSLPGTTEYVIHTDSKG